MMVFRPLDLRELLDSIIVDVASECHRIARLGLDRTLDNKEEEMRLSIEARAIDPSSAGEANSKNVFDIFGQTHPAIASEIFDCMNYGGRLWLGGLRLTWRSAWARIEKLTKRLQGALQWHRLKILIAAPYQSMLPIPIPATQVELAASPVVLLGEYPNYTFEGP